MVIVDSMIDSGIFSIDDIEVKIGDVISCKMKAASIMEIGMNIDSILVEFHKGCYCIRPEGGFIPIYQLSEVIVKEKV